MSLLSAAFAAMGLSSEKELVAAIRCVGLLRGARESLECSAARAAADPINVPLTKEQAALLIVLIDRELPKID